MYRFIKTEIDDRIATVTLDRPEVLNAWHLLMRNEFVAALADLRHENGG